MKFYNFEKIYLKMINCLFTTLFQNELGVLLGEMTTSAEDLFLMIDTDEVIRGPQTPSLPLTKSL